MDNPPNRSSRTDLTLDQLLLFDLLFQHRCLEHQLRRDQYAIHMNINYNHSLDDDALHDALLALEERGDATQLQLERGAQWALTPAGGLKWELERNPDWSTYCAASVRHSTNRAVYSVVSPSELAARDFWSAARSSRLWPDDLPNGRYRVITQHEMIYWRSFPELHVLAAVGRDTLVSKPHIIDWDRYESRRTWWCGLSELVRGGNSNP